MHTAVDAISTLDVHCILRIVDRIYAAACGEATWDQALALVCRSGALDGGALRAVDALERRSVVLASYGLGADARPGAPRGAMIGESPLADSLLRSTLGDVLDDRWIAAHASLAATSARVRAEVHGSWACVTVGRDDRGVVCLDGYAAAGRAPGAAAPGEFLRQLAPHLVRAWRIGRASRAVLAAPSHAACPPRLHDHVGRGADLAGLPQTARLRAEFGLTKAEARLALRLVDGSTLASAAEAFEVKLTTIRSQLQQVFAKTGTSRQSELVAMLLSCGYRSRSPHWHATRSTPPAPALAG